MTTLPDSNDDNTPLHLPQAKPSTPSHCPTQTSPTATATAAAIEFARLGGKLKTTPRTGWLLNSVPSPESVADHTFRVALLTLLLPTNNTSPHPPLDTSRCLAMALVHDLAESIVGDIAPADDVPPAEKRRMEEEAMVEIAGVLGRATGEEDGAEGRLLGLFDEYERRETREAVVVKDLDLLDMVLQAWEYEEKYPGIDLGEFFRGTPPSRFRDGGIRAVAEEVHRRRGEARGGGGVGVPEEPKMRSECVLTEDDAEFVRSYAASSNISVVDAEALVAALRARDNKLN